MPKPQEAPPTKGQVSTTPAETAGRLFEFVGSLRGVLALLAVLAVGAFFGPKNTSNWPIFLTFDTQFAALYEVAAIGLMAAGMTFVILTGGIDLSVGSVMGFVAMLFSLLYIKFGWNPVAAMGAGLLAGAMCGAINGLLITRLRLQPFVATLAMMAAARGGAQLLTDSRSIVAGPGKAFGAGQDIPFYTWMNHSIWGLGIRPITLIFVFTILAGLVVIRFTRFGRTLYAIGGNEEAARLSGINVDYVKIAAYAVCGITAALAGVCDAAKQGFGFPLSGFTMELDAIAAVVIGGTSLMGGTGSMFCTLVGTVLIADITKLLSLNNVQPAARLLAKGGLIVAAVMIQQRRTKRR